MDKVLVIMSTYNGEKYLQQQINSIIQQKDVEIKLVIRDDGSRDSTLDIIKENADKYACIEYSAGENIGFRRSFYDTLISSNDQYDYYAFADQDDVWKADKLIRAIEKLKELDSDLKLYTSALHVVNQDLEHMYDNTFKGLRINFGSALSRQRLAGCTMVFNKELFKMCCKFSITEKMGDTISHDAAVYYICLLCGGKVFFDEQSYIDFRRHTTTVTEHGKGLKKRVQSVTNIFGGQKNRRYNQVLLLREVYYDNMTTDMKELSEQIFRYKDSLKNTISLAMSGKLKSGIKSVDIVNFFAVILRCY